MIPLITIGISCYNAEDTIERAIRSAQHQDWPNFEIIVVDDASTDATWQKVETLARDDSRITAIQRTENRGPAASRNTILDAAKGEFIAFFDDDDESLPERIRLQYELIINYEKQNRTSLIACFASGTRYYPNGYTVNIEAIGSKQKFPSGLFVADCLLYKGMKSKKYFMGGGTPANSLMARYATFQFIGKFDEHLRRIEDVDFAIRLALFNGHFIGCPERLLKQYSTSAFDKSAIKEFEAHNYLIEKHSAYLKRRGKYQYLKKWQAIRYFHFSNRHGKMFCALFFFLLRYPIAGTRHFLVSGPRRWIHERKMRK
jgi:glycosyltransferase involved in cell wall biosynthesis